MPFDPNTAKPLEFDPASAQPVADENPGFLAHVKNAVIAPESERDPSLGQAIVNGITGIPAAIGSDFMENARQFGKHVLPSTPQELSDSAPIGGIIPPEALDVAGMVMSPATGLLKSVVGRPIEQQTGIRRGITGSILSAAIPLGGEANAANDAAKVEKATAALKPMALEAHNAGYVLPPKMISDKPGLIANTLAGWSGKIKTAQAASDKNQVITDSLAAKALGLGDDAALTPATFTKIRADAGKAYKAVSEAIPAISADQDYLEAVANLGRPGAEAAQRAFPNITKNQGIIDLQDELSSVNQFPTGAGIEIVKELRSQSAANMKNALDPSKQALGYAQRQAADAIDDLVERNLAKGGQGDLAKEYQAARVQIAKSYDVEGATNPATGHVDAQKIAKLAAKGKPLTGELATIAKVAQAFPKAMQSAAKFGETEPVSVLDLGASAVAAAHGNFGVGAVLLGRPIGRAAVLSKSTQNALVNPGATALDASVLRRAPAVNALHELAQQPEN